ncbi:hypothetical protein SD71_02430 [Cohnella kolymensis]|uniref:Lipoprotein n=1 Tax=Cohnella kolymensis TaxID=1590652 RepID=A0ABR5A9J3_9BACL|nr:hypothetical protein [Cohnella kolymensis]KIL37508.1 hypothetical protein SD71_02430 [Cohnella kolymensis]
MLKKLAATALICTIALTGAACSSKNGNNDAAGTPALSTASSSPSATAPASASENPDVSKTKAFIAGRMAEEKVNYLFHQTTSEDEKPILNPVTPDKESAAKFLNAYIDPALTEKILTYYLTEEKADNAIVVKSDPFFTVSILAAASKDDLTYEGADNEYKMTTKDGGVFTVKKNTENNFVLADFVKQ